jgi:cell division protein FtsL
VILRILNFVVIGALVLAAAYVYRIKYEATAQAEYLAKLRSQVRQERDKIADLRARWGDLDDPARIQDLAKRFLKLQPVAPTQFDTLDHLPDQPPDYMRPGSKDPIGGMIEHLEVPVEVTGSVPSGDAAASAPPDAGSSVPQAPQQRNETTAPPAAAPAQSGAGSE